MPPALLFDLDGTLVDSAPDIAAAMNRLLLAHGRPALTLAQVTSMVGDGIAVLVERALAATGGCPAEPGRMVEEFRQVYESAATVETRPFPGVAETLGVLQSAGHQMAVCTNKPTSATERILHDLDLDRFFGAWCGGDCFAVRKPDPGHLLGTLARIGGDPETAVMIGDSMNDIGPARAAGLRSIAVSYGYTAVPPADLGADVLVDGFAEIPAALSALPAAGRR